MSKHRVARKAVAILVLAGFVSVMSACYGPFNLTKNVYQWNSQIKGSGEINDKWMKEFVFFGMIVIPVYMFSALLDAFIFNSIQFWTGNNPVKTGSQDGNGLMRIVRVGESTVTMTEIGSTMTVSYERNGSIEQRAMVVPTAGGYRLVAEAGTVLAEAEYQSDGGVILLGPHCQIVTRLTADRLREEAYQLAELIHGSGEDVR